MQKHITINNMFPPTTHLTLPPYKHTPTISTISTTTTNAYSSLKTNPKQTPLLTFYDNTLKTLYLTFDKQQQQQQQQQRLHNVTLSPQQSSCYLKDKATLYKQSNSPYIINSKCNLTLFKEHIQHKAEQQQGEMNMNMNGKDVNDSNNTQQSTHLMKLKHKFDSFYNEVTNNDNHLLNNNNDKGAQSEQNKRDSMTVYLELLAKYSKFKQALNTRTTNVLYDKRSNSSNKCVVNTTTTTTNNKESNNVYDRNKRRKKSNLILKQCRLNIEHIKSYK